MGSMSTYLRVRSKARGGVRGRQGGGVEPKRDMVSQ